MGGTLRKSGRAEHGGGGVESGVGAAVGGGEVGAKVLEGA